MYRLSPEDQQTLQRAARHDPNFLKFFESWRQKELEELPAVAGNVSQAQGRCQVLAEVVRHIKAAIENRAQ